ncbi:MAG: glycosyltransferase family 39 protein [Sediminicola sp.]
MIKKLPKTFGYLLGALLLINLVQAHFTQLIFDEAYYWYYSQQMAWGYFDHPPMVALMVKIGSLFLPGELGVRFMSCMLSAATFVVLWATVDDPRKSRHVPHFFVLVFSMTLMNAYGFFTLPDTPLLFFTALFLWCYKKFLQAPSIAISIGMGVVMACLMYSKYHAVLVIFFVLLSNLKLVFNKRAWLAVAVALLCYTPHFVWLFQNDFVSIKYHLYERPNRAYDFADFTLGYFVNLVAIFGLTFPWIYKSLFKARPTSPFERALVFLVYGVLLFFFISSFNRRIQTQWIIVISIPMAVLAFQYLLTNANAKKWIYRTGLVNIAILFLLRIGLVYGQFFPIVYESHGNREWVESLESQIGDMPVVFENSYRNAPMYAFYSGNKSFSLNNIMYRQNQYTIDDSESKVQHQKILYVSKFLKRGDISYERPDGTINYGVYMEDFESYRKLWCTVPEEDISLKADQNLTLEVYNPYDTDIPLDKIRFGIAYTNRYKQVKELLPLTAQVLDKGTESLKKGDTTKFSFTLPRPKVPDPGYFKVSVSENGLYYGLNSKNIKLN